MSNQKIIKNLRTTHKFTDYERQLIINALKEARLNLSDPDDVITNHMLVNRIEKEAEKQKISGNEIMQNILTTKEVAEKLHMGINQTRDLIRKKDFPKITIGSRKWIIPEDELEKWIQKNLGKTIR